MLRKYILNKTKYQNTLLEKDLKTYNFLFAGKHALGAENNI